MQRLYTAADLPEAHLIVKLLQSNNIESHVFNENAQGAVGELPFTHTYPEVWIAQARDALRARQLIQEFEQSNAISGTKACSECHEKNPANFDYCWQCGALLAVAR